MPEVNLLPWREQRRRLAIRRFQGLLLMVGLLAALIVWLTDHFARQVQHRQLLENASLQSSIDVFDTQLVQLERHRVEQAQVQLKLQALEHLQGQRLFLVGLLEQLEQATPQGVHLTEVARKGSRLHIHGVARSGSLVAQLMRNLSSAVGSTDMQQMKAVGEGEAFELNVDLRGET